MTLDELNTADRVTFVTAIGWVFEQSPWVAERAWDRRPFESVDQLHATMVDVLGAASRDEILALLRAHPDLGARARMTDASSAEQTGAGLHALAPHEFEALQRLNTAYRDRFHFPFLLAVTGATSRDVLAALEHRLTSTAEEEWAESLRQVGRIARIRLDNAVRR